MDNQEECWNRLYKERLIWKKETIDLPKLLKGKSVLELGVGTGKTLQSILRQNPKQVVAVDFSEEALKICSECTKNQKVAFVHSDILKFNPDKKFDVIICYYLLNNFDEKERKMAVKKMQSLLTKAGVILFEDFAAGDFREKQGRKDSLFCHFFTEKEIRRLFHAFSDIKIKTRISNPIRSHKELKRKIISAMIRRPR